MKQKLQVTKEGNKSSEATYKALRETNDRVIIDNQVLKNELTDLDDRLNEEKNRRLELRSIKDKANH